MSETEAIQVDETKNDEVAGPNMINKNEDVVLDSEIIESELFASENPEIADIQQQEVVQEESNADNLQIFEQSGDLEEPVISTTKIAMSAQEELINYFDENFDQINSDISLNLFMTWLEENHEGFFIKDLLNIVKIIDLLIKFASIDYSTVIIVIDYFFEICSKPLIELKANERLSIQGLDKIEKFYSKLSTIWEICDISTKVKLGNCFRCIANGGLDPDILRCDIKPWVSDGLQQKVTDKQFIQKVLRETDALEIIVYEFLVSAKSLNYDSLLSDSKKVSSNNEASIETKQLNELEATNADKVATNLTEESDQSVKPSITRDFSQVMLNLCLEISTESKSAFQMCLNRLCDGAIVLIEKDFQFNPRDTRISYIIELMWNALEFYLVEAKAEDYLSSEADDIMDFERAIHVLQTLLKFNLLNGFRLSDKELRNEVLVILAMISQFPKSVSNFMESGLFNLLVTYACIEEVGKDKWFFFNKPVANSRNFSTVSDIDLEFKKEVWFTISELLRTNDPDALLCFASSPLLSCMLMYLEQSSIEKSSDDSHKASDVDVNKSASIFDPNMKDRTNPHIILKKPVEFVASLPLYKLREFQLLAVTFIVQNASKIICELERQDGIGRLIALIMMYSKSEMTEHKSLIFNMLILINKCLTCSLTVRIYLEDTNSIETFLYVFQKDENEDTRAQALRIISALCSNSNIKCQQQLIAINGIHEIIKPIEKYVQNRKPIVGLKAGVKFTTQNGLVNDDLQDPLENPYGGEISVLIIATLDCISKSVVGNKLSESIFAECEGVDALLDLLEISTFVLRVQVLRVLADILLNPMLVSYVNAWRSGKSLRSAAQILCHSWLDEEVRLDSERKENGVICDIWNPLGNQQWPKEEHELTTDDKASITLKRQSSISLLQPTMSSYDLQSQKSGLADNKSFTVTKLATAILTSRNIKQCNLPFSVCDKALAKDTRNVISSSLKSIGVFEMYGIWDKTNPLKSIPSAMINQEGTLTQTFELKSPSIESLHQSQSEISNSMSKIASKEINENSITQVDMPMLNSSGDLGLTPSDKQVLSMARKYLALREGEWWNYVKRVAIASEIIPIEADFAIMDSRLEYSFDAAQAVQMEQMELYREDQSIKKNTENQFIGQIITKKNQQIKSEWLKKYGKNKGGNPFSKRKV